MKLLIVISLSAWMIAAADGQTSKDPPAKAAVTAPARTVASTGIPTSAVKAADGSYQYTDPQGKKWIYRTTPFGTARFEDKPVEKPAESSKRFDNVRATADGDTIRFERPGPFGTFKWQRKKTELDEMEQAVWNREQSRAAGQD